MADRVQQRKRSCWEDAAMLTTMCRLSQYREENEDVSSHFEHVLHVDGAREPEELLPDILVFLADS